MTDEFFLLLKFLRSERNKTTFYKSRLGRSKRKEISRATWSSVEIASSTPDKRR